MSLTNLTIDQTQLSAELERLSTYSDAKAPAVTRVLFTEAELAGRSYVRQLMHESDLTIHEDGVGNIFARWIGTEPELSAIATGSHIDAIPFSGKYDGTVGVLGGLEAIRALQRAGYQPRRSIELLMFTAEEPTRFGIGCLGSRALAGRLSPDDLCELTDHNGVDFDTVRRVAGYTDPLDTVKLPVGYYQQFIELHIEQGARLEQAGLPLGIVTSIAAPATLRVQLKGEGGHAGTVLMPSRRDALLAGAEIALLIEATAKSTTSPDSVATTGRFEVYPGAVNSIPSRVVLEIDMRDTLLDTRDGMIRTIEQGIAEICERRQIDVETALLNSDPPAQSDPAAITALERAAQNSGLAYQKLVSRAYHDALFMGQICPTAMLFVPSQNGYSHRPEEYTTPHEIAQGVLTLARALAELSAS